MTCLQCGCSEIDPCEDVLRGGPCAWVVPGLCSACVPPDPELLLASLPRDGRPHVFDEDGDFSLDEDSGLWLPQ